jgi:hypothetical protein
MLHLQALHKEVAMIKAMRMTSNLHTSFKFRGIAKPPNGEPET